jgi:hypothetical protein
MAKSTYFNPWRGLVDFLTWCYCYPVYVMLGVFAFSVFITLMGPTMSKTRETGRKLSSQNHLKMIGLAMHNYHDVYQQLPRAYWLTPDGKRTLSWRVAISEFLSERMILKEHRASEPWDSTANQELAKRQRKVFEQPYAGNRPNTETAYMVITGPGTLFEEGRDISFGDCTDGLSRTILAVEVKDSGVNWLQPVDLDIRNMIFRINGGGMGISSPWSGGAQVVMADGSVKFLKNELLESTLRAMMTRAGGEIVKVP